MDLSTILHVLRDVLTAVGASKLVYEGYRKIKKPFVPREIEKKFQNAGTQISYYLNRLYKKAYGVRYNERFVRHSLQKKPSRGGIPIEIAGIPVLKKVSIDRILFFFNRILFLKKPNAVIFHLKRMIYLQAPSPTLVQFRQFLLASPLEGNTIKADFLPRSFCE